MLCPLFTQDSSLYASISKSFVTSHNYADMYANGKDWLDKPHFPFWVWSMFISILGFNAVAIKLPSFLFFLMALVYTYKLARCFYNKETAYLAVLILSTSLHIIVSNNDVRAEIILMGLIAPCMYYLYACSQRFLWRHLLIAAIFQAAAIMTKGIFVVLVFYPAIVGNMIFHKQYARLWNYKWIVLFLFTFIGIMPELYCLYAQFDAHPEKIIFGKKNVSGLLFFFIGSQFGRFFNTGPIQGESDLFFFVHSLLWSFAPWALLAYMAIAVYIKDIAKRKKIIEHISLLSFMTMFIIFSISKFQLPHYTNIIFPFAAIFIAKMLMDKSSAAHVAAKISVYFYMAFCIILIGLISYFYRPNNTYILFFLIPIFIIALVLLRNIRNDMYKRIMRMGVAAFLIGLYMNLIFYPDLLSYQSGISAAKYANTYYPNVPIIQAKNDPLFAYYARKEIKYIAFEEMQRIPSLSSYIIYVDKYSLQRIDSADIKYNILATFKDFRTTQLTASFFNYKTREKTLQDVFLIQTKESFTKKK